MSDTTTIDRTHWPKGTDEKGHFRHPDGRWNYERNNFYDHTKYSRALDDPQWQEECERRHRSRWKEIQKEIDQKATKAAEPIANALIMAGISGRGFAGSVRAVDEGYDLVALTGRQLMAKPIPPR